MSIVIANKETMWTSTHKSREGTSGKLTKSNVPESAKRGAFSNAASPERVSTEVSSALLSSVVS